LKIVTRLVVAAALALSVTVAATQGVDAKKDAPAPSPSPSGSPAPLPTATPESPDVAIPRLEAKIKADPNDKDSLQQLAGYYLQANKPDQALSLTQRLLALGVKTAQSYYLDGISNEALGHVKEATDDFEQASNLEPTNAQVLLTLTNLYLQTNRATDAERVAKRATTFNPTDKRAFENYGLVLGQEGKFDEARTQFQAAAKLDPKDPLPVVLQARAYVSQKSLPLAAQLFDQALVIDPKYTDALLGKASLEAANHDVKDAIPTYETLYALEPNDESKAAVIIQEYQLYRDEKMNDQAVAALKRAETTFPNVAGVHIAYGDYDVSLGKDQGAAETEWKTALGPNRDNPDALQRLGELALSQNKRADALGYFKRLTEVIPGEPVAWSALGSVQAQNGQFQLAHDSYRHSFELARTPQALAGLGTADLELKNYKECGEVFGAIDRNAQPFMKANPQLLFVYAKCSAETGDKTTAREAYSRFKAFVKPGSPLAHQIDQAIASLNPSAKTATKPTAKASPKPSPSH